MQTSANHFTVTFNVVLILGYEPDLATVSFTTQEVVRRGATKRPEEMEHAPTSDHVFFPLDAVVSKDVNIVFEPLETVDLFTTNPGRTDTDG